MTQVGGCPFVPRGKWAASFVGRRKEVRLIVGQMERDTPTSINVVSDSNVNGQFDMNEEFVDRGLNNLDLYLMPVGENDIDHSIALSVRTVDSVEHIFQRIPQTGHYKIRVYFQS